MYVNSSANIVNLTQFSFSIAKRGKVDLILEFFSNKRDSRSRQDSLRRDQKWLRKWEFVEMKEKRVSSRTQKKKKNSLGAQADETC